MNTASTATVRALPRPSDSAKPRKSRALFARLPRHSAAIGYLATALLLYVGWASRTESNIIPEEGLGYWLGIVGSSLMALVFLYPVRKRIRFLRFLGTTRHWFFLHMLLGIVGPAIILFHSNFALGSLNSRIALYCTLLVAGSGLVGRYLYAQIHDGLYGRRMTLRSLTTKMQKSIDQLSKSGGLVTEITECLTELDHEVIEPPHTLSESLTRSLTMAIKTRMAYIRLNWILKKKLIARSRDSQAITEHRNRLESLARSYLRDHLREVRNVAHLNMFERLFSFWHILHLPFFLMLWISAIVHIVAVHMY